MLQMAAGGGCVRGFVWEWQRKDGGFSPFPPQDSATIEAASVAGTPAYCNLSSGRVDWKNMRLRRHAGSRVECSVRRSPVTLPATPPIRAYWSWDEGGSNFAVYAIEAVVDIELAFMNSRKGRDLARTTLDLSQYPSQLPYTIDFSTMRQTRHGYMTQRAIIREEIPNRKSLQTLLQSSPPISTSSNSSNSRRGFSLSTGPATAHISKSGAGTGNSSTVTSRRGGGVVAGSTSARSVKGGASKKSSVTSSSSPLVQGGSAGAGGVPEYAVLVKELASTDDGPCPICMCQLSEQSGFAEDTGGGAESRGVPYAPAVDLCKLGKCGHMMHRPCLLMMLQSESAKNGLTCPTCKKVYGIKTGDMPNGTMTVRESHSSLPGHEDCGSIEIVYSFSPGVHNGRHFRANGFPRTCYLPNNPKGQKVLKLLRVAWERRLTFTIGTSVTTGATDTIVWNEIHHKTESSSNYSGHGYPDPNYLDNVLMELSLQGVTDSDSDSDDSL